MKKILIILLIIIFSSLMIFINFKFFKEILINTKKKENNKLMVTTTLYYQYDFVKNIVGNKAEVVFLLPSGIETHCYEPKPSDIIKIYNSDIFIYNDKNMEPWIEKIISNSPKNKKISFVNCSKNIPLIKNNNIYDYHFWLNPLYSMIIIDNMLKYICEKDMQNKNIYIKNANTYKKKLKKLDNDIWKIVNAKKKDTLFFGGHFPYIYFLNHYNLKYVSLYNSCLFESEPSIKNIKKFINYIKKNNISYIYYEKFTFSKIENLIVQETGVKPLLFNSAHNVSNKEIIQKKTYLDIMYDNLLNLEKGLI